MKKLKNIWAGLMIALIAIVVVQVIAIEVAPAPAEATGLTADRNTPMKGGEIANYKMAASVIYKGSLVCVTSSTGYVAACTDATGIVVVGVADKYMSGGSTAGAYSIPVRQNMAFKFGNSANHAIAQSSIGAVVYVETSDTVATTSNYTIPVGIVQSYDSTGVWVYIPSPAWQTSLAAVYGVGTLRTFITGTISADTIQWLADAYKGGSITGAYGYCEVAPADSQTATINITFDVRIKGLSIFSTKPSIARNATGPVSTYTTHTGVTPGVLDSASVTFAAGDSIVALYDVQFGATVLTNPTNCGVTVFYKTLVQ